MKQRLPASGTAGQDASSTTDYEAYGWGAAGNMVSKVRIPTMPPTHSDMIAAIIAG